MAIESAVYRVSASTPRESDEQVHWTVALAGRDGSRPEHELARLNQVTPASRTFTVIGAGHRAHETQLADVSDHVLRQPSSRDTGLPLYVALSMIKRWTPNATVTITPTDHHVDPSARYLDHVQVARGVATRVRDRVVILGVPPRAPDPELSYVSVGGQLAEVPEARRVVGYHEKPSVECAEALIRAGSVWNTMVAFGTVEALWSLGRLAVPHLLGILDSFVPLVGTADESEAIEYIYRAYLPVSFSSDMLVRTPQRLAVVELRGVDWSGGGRAGAPA